MPGPSSPRCGSATGRRDVCHPEQSCHPERSEGSFLQPKDPSASPRDDKEMSAVGIVGGLGVDATVHYYERITASCKARGFVPDLAIVHADVDTGQNLIRAGRLDQLAVYLAGFIERLAKAGAQQAVLPAVTPHICIKELAPLLPIPLINIVEVLAAELVHQRIRRV